MYSVASVKLAISLTPLQRKHVILVSEVVVLGTFSATVPRLAFGSLLLLIALDFRLQMCRFGGTQTAPEILATPPPWLPLRPSRPYVYRAIPQVLFIVPARPHFAQYLVRLGVYF